MDDAMDQDDGVSGTQKRPNDTLDGGEEEFGLAGSMADGTSRNSRLARKAESARQARLRHKQFVTDLQEQAAALQARIRELEAHCTTGPAAAPVALRELKDSLRPEQLDQLTRWLVEAQGDDHVFARYERGAALPPPPPSALSLAVAAASAGAAVDGGPPLPKPPASRSGASAPIAIGGGAAAHWRGGAHVAASPMESDEDTGAFPLSRSWDDIEGARSILNLNSPNGFHPISGAPPPMSFSLPTASSLPFGAPPSASAGGGGGAFGRSMLSSSFGNGAAHGGGIVSGANGNGVDQFQGSGVDPTASR